MKEQERCFDGAKIHLANFEKREMKSLDKNKDFAECKEEKC